MTSILAHKILQALLMLATSNTCPDADWYGEELNTPTTERIKFRQCFIKSYHSELEAVSCAKPHQRVVLCSVPLTPGMNAKDARTFFAVAKRLARG